MKPLSQLLTPPLLKELRHACRSGLFPGVGFEHAMAFLLTDGILPAPGLPAESFLRLEDWVRDRRKPSGLEFSATDLKNQTGRIIEAVLGGGEVVIRRHGKPIAVIRPFGLT